MSLPMNCSSRRKLEPTSEDIFAAVKHVHDRVPRCLWRGWPIANYGMFAFRDVYGIRPLCFGKRETEDGTEYAVVL